MISLRDALDLFLKEYPGVTKGTISDMIDFYMCSPAEGDMSDEAYKIDKKTGKVTSIDFLEQVEAIRKLPEDYSEEYSIQDLLKKKAS